MPLTSPERRLRAKLAANALHKTIVDEKAHTNPPARPLTTTVFEREVDPLGELDEAIRERMAANVRRAYMQRLALRSAIARRQRDRPGQGTSAT